MYPHILRTSFKGFVEFSKRESTCLHKKHLKVTRSTWFIETPNTLSVFVGKRRYSNLDLASRAWRKHVSQFFWSTVGKFVRSSARKKRGVVLGLKSSPPSVSLSPRGIKHPNAVHNLVGIRYSGCNATPTLIGLSRTVITPCIMYHYDKHHHLWPSYRSSPNRVSCSLELNFPLRWVKIYSAHRAQTLKVQFLVLRSRTGPFLSKFVQNELWKLCYFMTFHQFSR